MTVLVRYGMRCRASTAAYCAASTPLPGAETVPTGSRSQPSVVLASTTAAIRAPARASPAATGSRNGPVPPTTARRPASVRWPLSSAWTPPAAMTPGSSQPGTGS